MGANPAVSPHCVAPMCPVGACAHGFVSRSCGGWPCAGSRHLFASGGGMAVARHLATVAGPFGTVRPPDHRLVSLSVRTVSPGWPRRCWLRHPCLWSPPWLAPRQLVVRSGLATHPAAALALALHCRGLAPLSALRLAGVAAGSGIVRAVPLPSGCPADGFLVPALADGLALRPGGHRPLAR